MRWLILVAVVVCSGCAGSWAYWQQVGSNMREYVQSDAFIQPNEKYVYKDSWGNQVGSVERVSY